MFIVYYSSTLLSSSFWVERRASDLLWFLSLKNYPLCWFFFPPSVSIFCFFLDTFEMVSEDEDGKLGFKVNYHYMSQVKNANDANSAARARRLAQEAVTLSTSLPLSSSSSVFVRCDEERLDIMKVDKATFSTFPWLLKYSYKALEIPWI